MGGRSISMGGRVPPYNLSTGCSDLNTLAVVKLFNSYKINQILLNFFFRKIGDRLCLVTGTLFA